MVVEHLLAKRKKKVVVGMMVKRSDVQEDEGRQQVDLLRIIIVL